MAEPKILPPHRADLLIRPLGDDGQYVVKDPKNGQYFNLPPQEAFLLLQLDGQRTDTEICAAFEKQFNEPLGAEDLEQFLEVARGQKFLEAEKAAATSETQADGAIANGAETSGKDTSSSRRRSRGVGKMAQSVLFWRFRFFDPDRLFNWMAPPLSFLWTAAFFWSSLSLIVVASFLFWMNWGEYADYFVENLRWETLALAWVILFAVTMLHEFAHGLTCKHHGGEVHEVGFLLLFFMPCFYCNVSDAWLFREKSKRVWVTLAGGYCDLVCWALAILVWRVTLPHSLPYHCAWVVMSICGGRVFINFNPLIKLDGYYLFSDWFEIPNLRQRSQDHVAGYLRSLLWGATWPARDPRGRALLVFGLLSWCFSVFYLSLMFYALHDYFFSSWGVVGLVILGLMAWMIIPGIFSGLFKGEVASMFRQRPWRLAFWAMLLVGTPLVLFVIRMENWVSGSFKLRPTARLEVRAKVSGFLQAVHFDEGDRVSSGATVVVLDIPDLGTRLNQKQAEVREVEAKLRLLLAGSRPEEIAEQRQKVKRAKEWHDLAARDLERKQKAFTEESLRLDEQIGQAKVQLAYAEDALVRAKSLLSKKAMPLDHFQDIEKQCLSCKTGLTQAQAQKRERLAIATLDQEGELARRDKEHQDAQAIMRLLETGPRAEEIDAEKSRLARLVEEKNYLDKLQDKIALTSPISGVIVTPHLREKVGQYFKEGDLICEIEEPNVLSVEIPLEEQDIGRVTQGMRVELKPRSLPFEVFTTEVDRVAPQAMVGKAQSTVNVYCKLASDDLALRSGMTGYARISCGRVSVLGWLSYRTTRYVRTEFWW